MGAAGLGSSLQLNMCFTTSVQRCVQQTGCMPLQLTISVVHKSSSKTYLVSSESFS